MHVHPEIAALRGDHAAWRRVQGGMEATLQEWHSLPRVAAIRRDLDAYAAGSDWGECLQLSALLRDHLQACGFVDEWSRRFIGALGAHTLGEIPFRYRSAGGLQTVQLIQSGGATLSVVAYEPVASPPDGSPNSAVFADRESREIVLSGVAKGAFYELSGPNQAVECASQNWRAGDQISLKNARFARQVESVQQTLVMLQLTRLPDRPGPSCEIRLDNGAALCSASGDKAASQRLMGLAVLGSLESRSAIPAMKRCSLDRDEEEAVRWEAVRQLLALDTQRGLAVLDELLTRTGDTLNGPAMALREQLKSAYSQLETA